MKKIIPSLIIALLLCLTASVPAFASDGSTARLNDFADLLDDSEEQLLLAKLDEISERQQFDIAAVTADDLGGLSCMEYADDFFDCNGFGYGENYDGALLLISMEPGNHACWISTSGYGVTALTDAGIDYMLDTIVDDHLVYGDFYGAIASFADLSDRFVTQARNSTPYDIGNMPDEPLSGESSPGKSFSKELVLSWLPPSLIFGLIVAAIRIAVMKSKMKSVRMQAAAGNYVKENSLSITNSSEIFLYSNISRTKIESSSGGGSSTHTSSSGRSHGGGGRSF